MKEKEKEKDFLSNKSEESNPSAVGMDAMGCEIDLEQLNSFQKYKDQMQFLIESAAHDLKSPVANLKLISMLIDNTNDLNELKNYHDSIKTSLNRLNASIHGMVKIFQVLNQEPSSPSLIDVAKEINSIRSEIIGKLEESDTINVEIEERLSILYPRDYFRYIFKELFENSIRYRKENEPLHITIEGRQEDKAVRLAVKDTGSGMNLDKYGKNLFMAFKKFSPQQTGAGTGLFSIKTIVEKNGGEVNIDSSPESGTIVSVRLMPYEK
jgi:signal transduction histidine kinase